MNYIVVEYENNKIINIYNLHGKTLDDVNTLVKFFKGVDNENKDKTKSYKIYSEVE